MTELLDESISLTATTRPKDVEGWDSLANVSIMFAVEEHFGIRFADDDLAGIETVGELAARVDDALGRRQAA